MVSLSTLDWPGSCCTDQAVLKLMEILLPPHLKVLGVKEYKTTLSTLSFLSVFLGGGLLIFVYFLRILLCELDRPLTYSLE